LKPWEEIAVAFATALVEERFQQAHDLLAPQARFELTPESLREKLHGMYRGYAEGPPEKAELVTEGSREDWPSKHPGDVGWAYVGIEGHDFVEAVTVIVAKIDCAFLIRDVEWGRP